MADSHHKEKKTLSIDELISRAKTTETAEKFQISNNYYFILLSRYSDTLMKDFSTSCHRKTSSSLQQRNTRTW